jgi:hypothetical protein
MTAGIDLAAATSAKMSPGAPAFTRVLTPITGSFKERRRATRHQLTPLEAHPGKSRGAAM